MYLCKHSLNKHRAFEATLLLMITHDIQHSFVSHVIWSATHSGIIWLMLYVIQHEKTKRMYTKYTLSHYYSYHTVFTTYMSFVNCIKKSPIVCYISCKSTSIVMFRHKVMKFQNPKSSQILCAHKPYFLMLGHIFCYIVKWFTEITAIASDQCS